MFASHQNCHCSKPAAGRFFLPPTDVTGPRGPVGPPGTVGPPGGVVGPSTAAGYLVSHHQNDTFTAVGRLLDSGDSVFWPRDRSLGGASGGVGVMYIPARPETRAVLEKAAALGEHNLSGAVVNPRPFRELFADVAAAELPFRGTVESERVYMLTSGSALRIPTPPSMRNHGNRIASICEIVRWMGERAEAAGINVFTGFPAASLLVEGDRVTGVRTTPSGLDRDGNAGPGAMPDATKRYSRSAISLSFAIARRAKRLIVLATPARCRTSLRLPDWFSMRPGCCRTSTRACSTRTISQHCAKCRSRRA